MKGSTKEIKVNKEVLQKLIELSGYENIEIAQKMKMSLTILESIIEGERGFSITQLKKLAHILKRPMAAFFSEPIRPLPVIPDYRINRGKRLTPQIYLAQRKALYLIERLRELSEERSQIPPLSGHQPEQLAKEFRKYLDIELKKNMPPEDLLNLYKDVLEKKLKILIIEFPLKYEDSDDVRAFSIFSEISSIVLNESDHPSVKLFSLFHEICHLIKRNDGICSIEIETEEKYEQEKFCNTFSAEFLIPEEDLRLEIKMLDEFRLEKVIDKLTKIYGVSKQVIIRRLLNINYIDWNKFNELKQTFESQEPKSYFGRRNWEQTFKKRVGGLTIQEIKKAVKMGKISFYEAIDILGLKIKYAEKLIYG